MLALRKPTRVHWTDPQPTTWRDVNLSGRFVWLQKLAHKFLTKYGKTYIHVEEKDDYAVYTIDPKKLLPEIDKHRYIAEMIWSQRCEYLVCGYDIQRQLEIDPMIGQFVMPRFSMGNGNERREIMGLKIVLVPYVDGFFALPKL